MFCSFQIHSAEQPSRPLTPSDGERTPPDATTVEAISTSPPDATTVEAISTSPPRINELSGSAGAGPSPPPPGAEGALLEVLESLRQGEDSVRVARAQLEEEKRSLLAFEAQMQEEVTRLTQLQDQVSAQ